MKRAVAAALAILAVAALSFGCTKNVNPGIEYKNTRFSYERVLHNWTREAKRYTGLETGFLASSLYWSEDVTRAYASERTRKEALPADKALALTERLMAKHEAMIRFRVAFFTDDRRWNDLDKSPSSWKVYLIAADGAQVEPMQIKKNKIRPEAEAIYFPDTNIWNQTYEVTFPKTGADGAPLISETEGRFSLLIAGARARAEFVWELE